MAALAKPEPLPVGVLKTFGEYGPMYEILGPAPDGPKGPMVHIRVFFTEEELDDPLADMLEDPLELQCSPSPSTWSSTNSNACTA